MLRNKYDYCSIEMTPQINSIIVSYLTLTWHLNVDYRMFQINTIRNS